MPDDTDQICASCVQDPYLKHEISSEGANRECTFCFASGATFLVEEIADRVEAMLEQHFRRTSTEPDDFQYAMMKEGDLVWEREGTPLLQVIESSAGLTQEAAQAVLAELHTRDDYSEFGEETPFDVEAHYEEKEAEDTDLQAQWQEMERGLKNEARFFSQPAAAILEAIFDDLDEHKAHDGRAAITIAGPGTALT